MERQAQRVRPEEFENAMDRSKIETTLFYPFLWSFDSMNPIDELRAAYESQGLDESELANDPFDQFRAWFEEAEKNSPGRWLESNAVTLATASKTGSVTARTVLLKQYDDRGFVFFTNYDSDKAAQLAENPIAALLFHWAYMGRQIRIEGTVEKTSREISQEYFSTRPRGAQIGAHASPQSVVLESRKELEQRTESVAQQFEGRDQIPLPDNWGGYRLAPQQIEFWQGRESRLHDRLRYRKTDDGHWLIERLSP